MKTLTYLEYFRREKDLTLLDLAKSCGVVKSLIAQVEGRHRSAYPRLKRKLAEALGIEEEKLFDRESFAKTLRRR